MNFIQSLGFVLLLGGLSPFLAQDDTAQAKGVGDGGHHSGGHLSHHNAYPSRIGTVDHGIAGPHCLSNSSYYDSGTVFYPA